MDGGGDGGDGGGMDPCECVWSHELATRRIINMIRQTQDYCTENECITENTGAGSDSDGNTTMFFIGFWILLAMLLFILRPRSSNPPSKSSSDPSGPNYDPPAPALY